MKHQTYIHPHTKQELIAGDKIAWVAKGYNHRNKLKFGTFVGTSDNSGRLLVQVRNIETGVISTLKRNLVFAL